MVGPDDNIASHLPDMARAEGREGSAGPWASYLPLEVMRAMSHLMDLVRHRIPTHKHFRAAALE